MWLLALVLLSAAVAVLSLPLGKDAASLSDGAHLSEEEILEARAQHIAQTRMFRQAAIIAQQKQQKVPSEHKAMAAASSAQEDSHENALGESRGHAVLEEKSAQVTTPTVKNQAGKHDDHLQKKASGAVESVSQQKARAGTNKDLNAKTVQLEERVRELEKQKKLEERIRDLEVQNKNLEAQNDHTQNLREAWGAPEVKPANEKSLYDRQGQLRAQMNSALHGAHNEISLVSQAANQAVTKLDKTGVAEMTEDKAGTKTAQQVGADLKAVASSVSDPKAAVKELGRVVADATADTVFQKKARDIAEGAAQQSEKILNAMQLTRSKGTASEAETLINRLGEETHGVAALGFGQTAAAEIKEIRRTAEADKKVLLAANKDDTNAHDAVSAETKKLHRSERIAQEANDLRAEIEAHMSARVELGEGQDCDSMVSQAAKVICYKRIAEASLKQAHNIERQTDDDDEDAHLLDDDVNEGEDDDDEDEDLGEGEESEEGEGSGCDAFSKRKAQVDCYKRMALASLAKASSISGDSVSQAEDLHAEALKKEHDLAAAQEKKQRAAHGNDKPNTTNQAALAASGHRELAVAAKNTRGRKDDNQENTNAHDNTAATTEEVATDSGSQRKEAHATPSANHEAASGTESDSTAARSNSAFQDRVLKELHIMEKQNAEVIGATNNKMFA